MNKHFMVLMVLSAAAPWPPNCYAAELKLKRSSVHLPSKYKHADLLYSDLKGFSLISDDEEVIIPRHAVSKELRTIGVLTLACYQDAAFLKVCEQSDGELSLKSFVRGQAGGPIVANAVYWVVKGLGWGAVSTAVSTVVTTTAGGALGAIVGTGGNLAQAILPSAAAAPSVVTATAVQATANALSISGMTTGASAAISTATTITTGVATGGSALGAAAVAGVAGVSQAATEAAVETAATYIGMTGYAAFIPAAIETASLTAWAWAMALPTP